MTKLSENDIGYLTKKKYDFDAIGAAMAEHMKEYKISSITLDMFYDKDGDFQEYVVLRWQNGCFEARNAAANSLSCDVEEASKLLNGGYYSECDDYERLKKGSTRF